MATGVQKVDEQHKELIRHFNEFHQAMAYGKGLATATSLLGFLAVYTETHFTCEEGCMTRYQCPAAAATTRTRSGPIRSLPDTPTGRGADDPATGRASGP
jgi:hemerythrin-like metal-binding protein